MWATPSGWTGRSWTFVTSTLGSKTPYRHELFGVLPELLFLSEQQILRGDELLLVDLAVQVVLEVREVHVSVDLRTAHGERSVSKPRQPMSLALRLLQAQLDRLLGHGYLN